MKTNTKALHARADVSKAHPAATPIYQNSAFEASSDFFYTRLNNPNILEFEEAVKTLEETEYGIATTTGMSAINLTLSLLKPGDRLLLNKHIYGCTYKLFQWYGKHYQIEVIVEDLSDENLTELPASDMVFFETPTNPFLKTVNIQLVSKLAKAVNDKCVIVVDNTWATPLYQSPCRLGADISLHSATKYLSGHSDVMGGIILTNNIEIAEAVRSHRFYSGAILDPNSAWLLRRSLHTLEIRLERHRETTKRVVEFLRLRPEIDRLYYPEINQKQLRDYATLIFFDLREDLVDKYKSFANALELFSTGTGMACVTSMVAQPFSGSHASLEECEKHDMELTPKTVRLSFGMEDPDDLIADLTNAFESI